MGRRRRILKEKKREKCVSYDPLVYAACLSPFSSHLPNSLPRPQCSSRFHTRITSVLSNRDPFSCRCSHSFRNCSNCSYFSQVALFCCSCSAPVTCVDGWIDRNTGVQSVDRSGIRVAAKGGGCWSSTAIGSGIECRTRETLFLER